MNKLIKSMIGLAAGLALGASAMAATVEGSLFPNVNQLSDNSAEELIKNPNNQGGANIVEVGDRLRGIFSIDTIEWLSGIAPTRSLLAGSGNNELSGVFDITVASKVSLGPGGWFFTFTPTGNLGSSASTAVTFYDGGPVHNFDRGQGGCATTAACEATATDGMLLWEAGFGSASAFWTAIAISDDISVIGGTASPLTGGSFNVGLDLIANYGTRVLQTVNCAAPGLEFCGSGSLLGIGTNTTPYDSFDNVDFVISVVPEPGSIALVGLALLGLGAGTLRRKS